MFKTKKLIQTHIHMPTFKLIPFGFSMSKVINMLCKSPGLAPTFLLRPDVSCTVLVVLVGISFSELSAAFSLFITLLGKRSSTAWCLGIFTFLNGDTGRTDCSGGDGRGEDECLPFAVAVEDNPDLWTGLGVTLAANGEKHYSWKKRRKEKSIRYQREKK